MAISPLALSHCPLSVDATGVAISAEYGDVFHSRAGGLAQARHVFLAGNDLPARWAERPPVFTIVETGLGLATNFLATWLALREAMSANRAPQRLHYIAYELHPFAAADIARYHAADAELAALASELAARWPAPIRGLHRVVLDSGRVNLTVGWGDALLLASETVAAADAFYLDGFAPERNAALWSPEVLAALARLAKPRATCATWCVRRDVRDRMTDVGFSMEKRKGFGGKREMLIGQFAREARAFKRAKPEHVVIVGAGIAGASLAERLSERGIAITLIDAGSAPASGASGNAVGLARPLLHVGATTAMSLSWAAHGWWQRRVQQLPLKAMQQTEILHLAQGRDETRTAQAIALHRLPKELIRLVDAAAAGALAGVPVATGGAVFADGLVVQPSKLVAELLARCASLTCCWGKSVNRIDRDGNQWVVRGDDLVVTADAVMLAAAHGVVEIVRASGLELPIALGKVRGQVSYVHSACGPRIPLTGAGYVVPMTDAQYCLGATFVRGTDSRELSVAEHQSNLDDAQQMLPGFVAVGSPAHYRGRASHRSTTPLRLPLIAPLAENLHTFTGLGSRGLLWAGLTAEALASELCDEPLPVTRNVWRAIQCGQPSV